MLINTPWKNRGCTNSNIKKSAEHAGRKWFHEKDSIKWEYVYSLRAMDCDRAQPDR